jgi:outer membrane protein assembly factor BamB
MAIDIPTATRTTFFVPANRTTNGGGIWGYGGVSIEPGGSDVYTATGNAVGSPENFRYCENVVRLTSSLGVVAANYPGLTGFDVDFGSTPVLFQPPGCNQLLAAENKNGELMIYDRNAIASGPLQRVQCSASNNTFIGDVAYSAATNLMYVSNSTDSPNGQYPHGLLAFAVQGCRLQLAWQKTVGVNGTTPPPPAVANGVVYWGSGSGSQLFAFDASSGTQLWSSGSTISGGIYEAPVVVNGRVYVGGWDKKLYCFAP